MNFKDLGIIIDTKYLKENNAVVSVFTLNHGIYSGVVRTNSKQKYNGLMAGNLIDFQWNARLQEHLGYAKCELKKSYSARILMNKEKLYAFNSIMSIIRISFPERYAYKQLFNKLHSYIEILSNEFQFTDYIKMELAILEESGYGLKLDKCGDTGQLHDLEYVSPKTGRAICSSSGLPYKNKLLLLPRFMIEKESSTYSEITKKDITLAFNLTGYFFDRYIWPNKKMPPARQLLLHSFS